MKNEKLLGGNYSIFGKLLLKVSGTLDKNNSLGF